MSKTKVYFNSACPVCDAGVKYQRKKLDDCAGEIEWIDVHSDNEAVVDIGADLEFVRERLHVVDEAGLVHVGSEAFAELWIKSEQQKTLARFVRVPVMRTLARWAYNGFARLLYWWNRINRNW